MAVGGWDRTASNPNNFRQQQSSQGQQNTSGQTTQQSAGSTTQRSSSVQASSSYAQNLTPNALSILDQLLQQLSDRPNISQEQLDSQAPLPIMQTVRTRDRYTGYPSYERIWVDPKNGRTLSASEAQQLTTERKAEQQQLIQQAGVIPGGTEAQRANTLARQETVNKVQGAIGDYSKAAAFQDSQALVQQLIRQVEEGQLATLSRAAEGAGTSQSAVRGLLVNDLAARTAENAGALATKTAVDYGNIQTNLSNVLQNLTQTDPVTQALLEALGVAKGAVQSGSNVTTQQNTTTTDTKQTQVTNSNQQQQTSLAEDLLRKAASTKNNLTTADLSKYEQGLVF